MSLKTVKFDVSGWHCSSCTMLTEMNVGDLDGVESVKADMASHTTTVVFDPETVSVERIREEIVNAGYDAKLVA